MKNISSLFFAFVLLMQIGIAQEEHKREFRATWVATVANIDWPKSAHRNNPELQKAELIRMLDVYKATNVNTILLQVRTECDAFYNSAYEPWSRFLTYTQGDDPGYDPLQFAIEEGHKRGIEIHAWMNPYRINYSASDGGSYYHSTHVYKEHPEWAIVYESGKKILNPGRPEVMSYIGAVVRDLVANYAIDGVHFDDYFYSYDGTPSALDAAEYEAYGNDLNLGDWRRKNVNRMMDTVYKVIQEENPTIRFGVSPFGIYKNGVPAGINGMDAFSQIYCDPLAWLQNGSVDYLTPQLYWPTGGSQDFETLANWWANQLNLYGRHLYNGHGSYRLSDNPDVAKTKGSETEISSRILDADGYYSTLEMGLKGTGDPVSAWTLSEIGKQIDIMRLNHDKNSMGSVFFSAKDFDRVNGFADYLLQNKYTHKTLHPEMTWKTMEAPQVPANLSSVATEQGDALTWDYSSSGAHRFAIYLSNDDIDALTIIGNPVYLAKVTYEKQVLFSDINIASGSKIVVTAISQIGQESNPSDIYQLDIELPQVELLSPDEGSIVGFTSELAWQSNIADATFFVQIATNQSFGNVVYSSGWVADSVLTIADLALEGETIYYWRVKAKDVSEGPYSVYQSFTTGFPDVPQLIYPGHLEQNIAQQPKIRWNASLITDQIEVIISDDINSTNIVAQELFSATNGEAILNTKLGKETWYYLKIRAINNFGHSYFAGTHAFKTSAGEIPVVSLVAPEDNAVAASFDFLQWQTSTTEGTISFLLEIAVDEAFNSIISSSGWLSTTELSIADLKLEGGRNYYWRVKAKSEFGEGDFSEIRNYLAGYPARPAISSPLHLSENADINPLIIWSASADSDSMLIEFSEQSNYTGIAVSGMLNASLGEGKVNKNLSPLTWYYLRIKAINEFGSSIYSSNKYFKTGEGNALIEKNNSPIELYPTIINQGGATLKVHLSVNSALTVNVLNILGQNVYQLVPTKVRPAGYYDFLLDASKVNTKGIYYLQILIDNQVYSKKLLIQ